MALTPGSRLGHCEIIAAIGAGGMAKSIARDPRLDREVAIKVLSASLRWIRRDSRGSSTRR